MNIKIEYEPTAKELTKASSLYAEKKPLLLFTVTLLNIFASIFFAIFFLKLFFYGLLPSEWAAAAVCILWLFFRRPFNEWLLYQRMKHSLVLSRPIIIEISRNGVVWSGRGLRAGNMSWDQIKYVMETQNGYILPNSFTKFLWLPTRGFKSSEDIEDFKELIAEKKVSLRKYLTWRC